MDTIKLKPCPFCGSDARTYQDTSSDYERQWTWYVMCDGPECRTESNHYPYEAQAIDQWNDRTEQAMQLNKLRMAFLEWLRIYEIDTTMRWRDLSVTECDTLGDVQWVKFMKEYSLFVDGKSPDESSH